MESKGEFAAGVLWLLDLHAEVNDCPSPIEKLKQVAEKQAPHLLGSKVTSSKVHTALTVPSSRRDDVTLHC